jgi:hypothetical protein
LMKAVLFSYFAFADCKPGKHKPRKPSPIGRDDNSVFDYCGYHNFLSGERCGDQAGNSFCIPDVDGYPACVVSVWCYNLHQSCSSNSDCPKDTICGNTCGNGYQCNPLCGNQELPYDPLHDDAPYYFDSYRCYDKSDVPAEAIPFSQDLDGEGRSYSSFLKSLETSSTSVTNPYSFPNKDVFVFLTLTIMLVVGTVSILRHYSPLTEHHFREISTFDHSQRSPIVELEPPPRSQGTSHCL